MSGGFFDYEQYKITDIAESVKQVLATEELPEGHEDERSSYRFNLSEETKNEFRAAVYVLELAAIYAQRIDWLLSSDDGEDCFHRRLNEELDELMKKHAGVTRDHLTTHN